MGKKRNRDKAQVNTDTATDECKSVDEMDTEEEFATSFPCTPSKSPPGKKGKLKMNTDERGAHQCS